MPTSGMGPGPPAAVDWRRRARCLPGSRRGTGSRGGVTSAERRAERESRVSIGGREGTRRLALLRD